MLGKNITIIGGSGGMGRVFTKFFKKHGFNIILHARNEEKLLQIANELHVNYNLSLKESVKDADIVMISIPITSTADIIKEVAPLLKTNSLIFDITSLKYEVIRAYEEVKKKYSLNCLSLHPMFGPGIRDMRNYVMLVLRVGGTENYNLKVNILLELFKSEGLIITETTLDIHDKRIATVLGIPHMFNILFLNLLKRLNEPLNELTKYTGTTFLLQKIFAESIIQREIEMFGDIQMENVEFYRILDQFEKLLKDYKDIIQHKDKKRFLDIFTQGINYSKADIHFKDSYNYFYKFMEILKK